MSAEALETIDQTTATTAPPCDVHQNRITNLDPPNAPPDQPNKPVSQAKLAANRANAAKSTGPRTGAGKETSARKTRMRLHAHRAWYQEGPPRGP